MHEVAADCSLKGHIMREDVKLLKEQGIHTYCVCGKLIKGDYQDTHFQFNYWVGVDLLTFKALPIEEGIYAIYFLDDEFWKETYISDLATTMRKVEKKILDNYTIHRNITGLITLSRKTVKKSKK